MVFYVGMRLGFLRMRTVTDRRIVTVGPLRMNQVECLEATVVIKLYNAIIWEKIIFNYCYPMTYINIKQEKLQQK